MAAGDFIDIEGGGVDLLGQSDSVFEDTPPSGPHPMFPTPNMEHSMRPMPPAPAIPPAPVAPPAPVNESAVVDEEDVGCSMEVDGLFVDDDGGCTEVAPPPTFAEKPKKAPLFSCRPEPKAPQTQDAAPAPATVQTPAPKTPVTPTPSSPVSQHDFMAAMSGAVAEKAAPAAEVIPPAAPVVTAPALAQAPEPAKVPVPAPVIVQAPTQVQDYKEFNAKADSLKADIDRLKDVLGVSVIENPRAVVDPHNVVQIAIWNMRHNPAGIVQMAASQLCVFESALSAHQVYVQSLQNEWQAQYTFLGREMDRVLRKRRRNYKGDTEKDREEACLDAEPEMAKLRNDFLRAQALSIFLDKMGERFAQLEDGLKRTISNRHEEEKRSYQRVS